MDTLSQWLLDKLIHHRLEKGILLDIGAYQGAFSQPLLDSNQFSAAILFEANVNNSVVLQQTFSSDQRVSLVEALVSDTMGKADFYCSTDLATGSTLSYDTTNPSAHTIDIQKSEVLQLSLDAYLEAHPQTAPITIIKIDTQGNDLKVLQGATHTLKKHQPLVVIEMIFVSLYLNQSLPHHMIEWLDQQGYQLANMFNIHYTADGLLAFSDAVFMPKDWSVHFETPFVAHPSTEHLVVENQNLQQICEERLALIHQLHNECEIRVRLIEQLHQENEKKRLYIEKLSQEIT